MLEEFRRLACSFAVPLMVVNGAKLLELVTRYRVETKPTPQVCRDNRMYVCIDKLQLKSPAKLSKHV